MTSADWADIRARQRRSLDWLRPNGIERSACDEFEHFLQAPGTLERPSLVVRCRRTDRGTNCKIVVDKPLSRPRLENTFLPYLMRLENGCARPFDFFVLVSDNIYVTPGRRRAFVSHLERVAFLRCDRLDDDIGAHTILIPDFSLLDTTYPEEFAAVRATAAATDFCSRSNVIAWRGRLSGPDYPDVDNCEGFPRYTLLMMSARHPDIINARLTDDSNLYGSDAVAALRTRLEALFDGPEQRWRETDFAAFKYLVSIDGAVSAWRRVPMILASGSVLLLQHRWSQFFYPGLQPWIHYVPLKSDVSDILRCHDWLQSNPADARTIAENGSRFADEILHPDSLERYTAEVIDACAALYRD